MSLGTALTGACSKEIVKKARDRKETPLEASDKTPSEASDETRNRNESTEKMLISLNRNRTIQNRNKRNHQTEFTW